MHFVELAHDSCAIYLLQSVHVLIGAPKQHGLLNACSKAVGSVLNALVRDNARLFKNIVTNPIVTTIASPCSQKMFLLCPNSTSRRHEAQNNSTSRYLLRSLFGNRNSNPHQHVLGLADVLILSFHECTSQKCHSTYIM